MPGRMQIGLPDDGRRAGFLTGNPIFRSRFSKYLQKSEFEMLSHAELFSAYYFLRARAIISYPELGFDSSTIYQQSHYSFEVVVGEFL